MKCRRWLLAIVVISILGRGESARAGLMGSWLFEEGSGTTALDSSGNGRDGTEAGATGLPSYAPGLYAGSQYSLRLNSDGTTVTQANGQKVVLPNATNFITNAPGATLMAWVKLEGNGGSNNRTILSISNNDATQASGGGATRASIQIINSGGNAQVRALGRKDDSGGSSNATSGTNFLTVGQTYFITGVFDYLGGGVRLYINGAQVGSTNVAAWTTNSANSPNLTAAIGTVSAPAATQEYWPGLLDGVRVYDTAFSAAQVLDTYTTEAVPEPTAIVLVAIGGMALALGRRKG